MWAVLHDLSETVTVCVSPSRFHPSNAHKFLNEKAGEVGAGAAVGAVLRDALRLAPHLHGLEESQLVLLKNVGLMV